MSALPVMPPAGSRVRIVVRDLGAFYGDIIPAKLKSGRWPIAPWGLDRTFCIAPEDVMELEVIDPPGDFVQRVCVRQRDELADRYTRARRESASEGGKATAKNTKKGLCQR